MGAIHSIALGFVTACELALRPRNKIKALRGFFFLCFLSAMQTEDIIFSILCLLFSLLCGIIKIQRKGEKNVKRNSC